MGKKLKKKSGFSRHSQEPENGLPSDELDAPVESAPVFDEDVSFEVQPDVPIEAEDDVPPEAELEYEPEVVAETADDIASVDQPAKDSSSIAESIDDAVDLPICEAVDEDRSVGAASAMNEHKHEDARNHNTSFASHTEQNIFLPCITCTRMILIVFKGNCPFSTLKPFHDPGVPMMAFTTCRKCVKDCKAMSEDTEMFAREAEIALSKLHMSPKLITNSYLYKLASTIAPTNINVLQERCEVKYYPMHKLLDEMTEACMIMSVLTDEGVDMRKEKLLMPFVPGAFL